MTRRRRALLALAAPVLGGALVAGCSSRQAEADARAEEGVAQVVALLERVPRQQWARPSAAVREQPEAPATSVDWSDASAAHDAALVDISGALDRTQEEVRRGRVVDRRQAEAELTRGGLVVRVLPSDDPTTLRATVQRTARSERMGDTSRSVSATSCTTVTVSVDPGAPYCSSVDGRACSPR